jgi:hypothetical protein
MIQMMKLSYKNIIYVAFLGSFLSAGCSKLVDIDEPIDTTTTAKLFLTDDKADQTIAGMYAQMTIGQNTGFALTNGGATLYAGLAADELVPDDAVGFVEANDIFKHKMLAENSLSESILWIPTYKTVYTANAILDGEAASTSATLTQAKRNDLKASAKFVRAFCFFYLTNFFGDIPLPIGSNHLNNMNLKRAPQAEVYERIIADLEDALLLHKEGTSQNPTIKNRANKQAIETLLARAYLYIENWEKAEFYDNEVISKGPNTLGTLEKTFTTKSNEAIFQLSVITNIVEFHEVKYLSPLFPLQLLPVEVQDYFTDPDVFAENSPALIPPNYMNDNLANAFENGDKRKEVWASYNPTANIPPYNGKKIYFAYKYKNSEDPAASPGSYTVLRLAEAYLIRAEARAMRNEVSLAAEDIDKLRLRAGLGKTTAADQDALIKAIAQERRVELFAEWGHRFFDLKRTGKALAVLSTIPEKSAITKDKLVFPIPKEDIKNNPKLIQNPGY